MVNTLYCIYLNLKYCTNVTMVVVNVAVSK